MSDTNRAGRNYSLLNLCYAKTDMPKDFFGGAGIMSNQGTATVPMHMTLIKGEHNGDRCLYLVDCGFKEPIWFERYGFYDWEDPRTVLAKVDAAPEHIQAILVTHMHFDHIGQLDIFPNAHIYLQRTEFEGWSQALNLPPKFHPGSNPWLYSSFEPKDMQALARAEDAGRLTLLDGDTEVFPGITGRLATRCHTFGSCWWEISTADGPFIIAGDTVYWYANLEQMWPPGYGQGDAFELLLLYDILKQRVDDRIDRIIPGHDYALYKKYPSWIKGKNPVAEVHCPARMR